MVLDYEVRERDVYLPAGTSWTNAWTGEKVDGGKRVKAEAPLERIPPYIRGDRRLPIKSG